MRKWQKQSKIKKIKQLNFEKQREKEMQIKLNNSWKYQCKTTVHITKMNIVEKI